MRWLWGSAVLGAWLTLPASAAAEDEDDRIPAILGLGVRRSSGDARGYELFSAATLAVITRDKSLALTYVGAIGSDGSGPSGTLEYSLSYGPVLGPGVPVTSGLALRSGADLLLDTPLPFTKSPFRFRRRIHSNSSSSRKLRAPRLPNR